MGMRQKAISERSLDLEFLPGGHILNVQKMELSYSRGFCFSFRWTFFWACQYFHLAPAFDKKIGSLPLSIRACALVYVYLHTSHKTREWWGGGHGGGWMQMDILGMLLRFPLMLLCSSNSPLDWLYLLQYTCCILNTLCWGPWFILLHSIDACRDNEMFHFKGAKGKEFCCQYHKVIIICSFLYSSVCLVQFDHAKFKTWYRQARHLQNCDCHWLCNGHRYINTGRDQSPSVRAQLYLHMENMWSPMEMRQKVNRRFYSDPASYTVQVNWVKNLNQVSSSFIFFSGWILNNGSQKLAGMLSQTLVRLVAANFCWWLHKSNQF